MGCGGLRVGNEDAVSQLGGERLKVRRLKRGCVMFQTAVVCI